MAEDIESFLAHHGVLGMHWGIRKKREEAGPRSSHAVSDSKKASRAAKAQPYEKHAADIQKQINKIKALPKKNRFQARSHAQAIADLQKEKSKASAAAAAKKSGHLTKDEKDLAVIGGITAAAILAKVGHVKLESGEITRLKQIGEAAIKNRGKATVEFARNEALANKAMSIDEISKKVQAGVNPDFGKIGTKMNCRRCTFAYEMRRRGFDVQATRTTNASGQNALGLLNALNPERGNASASTSRHIYNTLKDEASGDLHSKNPAHDLAKNFPAGGRNKISGDVYKDPYKKGPSQYDRELKPTAKNVLDALSKEPERSRGELGVQWLSGGGHSMAYEIIDGKAVIFDNQTGKVYRTVQDLTDGNMSAFKSAGYTRLDNVKLNQNFLLRWVQGAK